MDIEQEHVPKLLLHIIPPPMPLALFISLVCTIFWHVPAHFKEAVLFNSMYKTQE